MYSWSKASLVGTASADAPPSSSLSAVLSIFRRFPSLSIIIDDERTVLASVVDFELLLGSRIECPPERVEQLARRSTVQLSGSLKECQQVIDKLDTVFERMTKKPIIINELLGSMQLPRGARDHGWSQILHSLGCCGPAFDLYKMAALTKFRLYLVSVRTALMHATLEAAKPLCEVHQSIIEPNSKELVAIVAPTLTTRVPPQCVA